MASQKLLMILKHWAKQWHRHCTKHGTYKTVDRYVLRSFPNAIGPSEWLTNRVDRMASDQWPKCVKVRAAVLQNRLRESRDKPFTNTISAASCLVNESLGHTVQHCHITDCPQHNSLVKMLAIKLSAMGFITRVEARIPTVEGTKITDLCAWKDPAYVVCDVAVGSDIADLDKIHFSKFSKYD